MFCMPMNCVTCNNIFKAEGTEGVRSVRYLLNQKTIYKYRKKNKKKNCLKNEMSRRLLQFTIPNRLNELEKKYHEYLKI